MNPYQPLNPLALEAFETPEQEWIIEDITPAGSLSLLTGREKSGKGLIGIDACVSIATGESFAGRLTTPCPTMYAFGEENIREVRNRVMARLGPLRDVPVYVLPLNGQTEDRFSLELPETLQMLAGAVVQYGIRFLVLDTLREFHNRAEDSSDDMAPLLKPLRQMAHDLNIAIWLNHHQNKGNTPRGSTAILAATDQSISFLRSDPITPDSPPEPGAMPKGVLTVDGRFGPRLVLHLELGADMRWEITSARALPTDAPKRDIVLEYIRQATDPITAEDVATGTGINLKTTQNLISVLLREEVPPIKKTGSGRKGDPRRFSAVELFPSSGNDGNDLGMKNGSQNDSQREGYGFGNDSAGNHPPHQPDSRRGMNGQAVPDDEINELSQQLVRGGRPALDGLRSNLDDLPTVDRIAALQALARAESALLNGAGRMA